MGGGFFREDVYHRGHDRSHAVDTTCRDVDAKLATSSRTELEKVARPDLSRSYGSLAARLVDGEGQLSRYFCIRSRSRDTVCGTDCG